MAKKKKTEKDAEEKKTAAKKAVKKTSSSAGPKKETAAKKPAAKKTVAKKETAAKEPAAKKAVAKKETAVKEPAAKKAVAKKETAAKADPKVRYSNEELEYFKKRILDLRQEAMDELRMLKERLEDLTNYDFAEESMIYSMHMAEQGSEAMEKEKTYAQIQRINEYIKKLDEALQRIKEKTYGICRVCGCLIAKERLWAVPVTTLSASYKVHGKCPEDGIDRIEPLKK